MLVLMIDLLNSIINIIFMFYIKKILISFKVKNDKKIIFQALKLNSCLSIKLLSYIKFLKTSLKYKY